uniref:Uncharacterized protein n=1 Tax=Solanum lycopersicum TaxID=4081 RepID=A0A3Q7G2T9_SOLLC
MRLHAPVPLLVPRECREETEINGYIYCTESFKPERLEQTLLVTILSILRLVEGEGFVPGYHLPLAQLLYHFDWNGAKRLALD